LLLVLVALAVIQIVGIVRILSLPDDVVTVVSLSRTVEMIAGVIWSVIWLWQAVRLLRNRNRSRNPGTIRSSVVLFTVSLTAFVIYNVGRIALFARADYDRQRLPLLIMATLILIAVVGSRVLWFYRTGLRRKQG
jgi:uncharacterized protein with PQ loop repeat